MRDDYKHGGFDNIVNPNLRNKKTRVLKSSSLKIMDKLTCIKSPVSMTLYRGIKISPKELPPGKLFTDHGFTSTSVDPKVAANFSGMNIFNDEVDSKGFKVWRPTVVRINAPKGTKGCYLDHKRRTKHSEEKEFLLSRGTTFKVTGHKLAEIPIGYYKNFGGKILEGLHNRCRSCFSNGDNCKTCNS